MIKTIQPRLCFVGNMLGQNKGFITTQGQILSELFTAEGYDVKTTSAKINKAVRLADIGQFLIKQRRKIDLLILEIYSGQYMVIADVATKIANYLKIPVIGVLHGGHLPQFTAKYQKWVIRVLRRMTMLVAPSRYLAEGMQKFGFTVRVIPNVLETEKYEFRLRTRVAPHLLWMRSFHVAYNPLLAVKVIESLRESFPDISLTMAGKDKGLESEIKEFVRQKDLQKNIRFAGFLNFNEKITEFSRADIYLNTNRIDNTPVAVLEACASGLPVVTTAVGGIPYLLEDKETALLVPDEDTRAMANAIDRLITEPQLAAKLSQNGRMLAENSSWTRVRSLWEEIFAEVLK
jgi:L-malate glycosyltransferase